MRHATDCMVVCIYNQLIHIVKRVCSYQLVVFVFENYRMVNNFYSFRLLNVDFSILSWTIGHYLHPVIKAFKRVGLETECKI